MEPSNKVKQEWNVNTKLDVFLKVIYNSIGAVEIQADAKIQTS